MTYVYFKIIAELLLNFTPLAAPAAASSSRDDHINTSNR